MQILFVKLCVCSVAQLSLTVCNPMDCSPSGSSVHGISQARTLEWVAVSSRRRSFWPRDWALVSCLLQWQADFFYHWTSREALQIGECISKQKQQRCLWEFCCCFCFWLRWVLVVASGSSFLTRDWTPGPLHGEHGVLTTGPSGSLSPGILSSLFFLFPHLTFLNFNALISNTLRNSPLRKEWGYPISM